MGNGALYMEGEYCKGCFYSNEFDSDGVFCSVCREELNYKCYITPENWLKDIKGIK